MVTETLSLEGDLLDRNLLAQLLDRLNAHAVTFTLSKFHVGTWSKEPSLAELHLQAESLDQLHAALEECRTFGALFSLQEATLVAADRDGVLPEDFYSTTNFPTQVLIEGQRVPVENLEMDCGIRVWRDGDRWRAATCAMHRVRVGDQLVVGYEGVRVSPDVSADEDGEETFRFMSNDISSERPKRRMIAQAAADIRAARDRGERVLLVGGPAIVHSGCAPVLAGLIRDGWITVLFAGNALAAHDIESHMLGTSLGVDLTSGRSKPHGHTHHLRAINRVRRAGSIAAAVESGLISGGAMHACVVTGVPFVLCGSIRDDGPLPDVITDNVRAVDAMREHIPGVAVCLMVATTLHSVATGNILPASVKTYCVDSDADTVIKLTDRGTHQAIGIVTDCEFFMNELARQLAGESVPD
ncbi:MAG: TIGR00300 family protein [Fimbriimonadaceae bacterium]|nr:TIGR00300 family protein [Fimbriimonadaceae bacterium]